MSVGTGAAYLKNLPAPGTYVIDPVAFARETSRNRKPNPSVSIGGTGYGVPVGQKVDATGIVGRLLLKLTVTVTSNGVGTPTFTSQWPWNIIKMFTLSANGIANLISVDGLDLRAIQRVRNPYFLDRESSWALTTGVSDVNVVTLYFEVPLAFDDESLMGAVFAQTQDTTLAWSLTTAAAVDLFATQTPTLSAFTIQTWTEFYSLPYVDVQGGRQAIIPDLRRMHGITAQTAPLASTSYSPLQRVNGVLTRVLQRGDNAIHAAGDVNWSTLCTNHQFNYGSNMTPYDDAGSILRMENEKDYGDSILPSADATSGQVRYIVNDLARDNALRDVVHLLGVTSPQYINIFSGLTVSNGNDSVVRTVQEQMVAGQ